MKKEQNCKVFVLSRCLGYVAIIETKEKCLKFKECILGILIYTSHVNLLIVTTVLLGGHNHQSRFTDEEVAALKGCTTYSVAKRFRT